MRIDTAASSARSAEATIGASVDLRYVARAGLLSELSRQTYDSLWKAIREAVLNAVDAGATTVEVDFAGVPTNRELRITDNGCGMSMAEFCDQFMSLGGSSRFGDITRFGRIGIGSLALLQYGEAAVIETKIAGSSVMTRATIRHPWDLGREQRRSHLADLAAGSASEVAYDGDVEAHFTRVRVLDVNAEVMAAGADPTSFYALLERLRRVLPLPWKPAPLIRALAERHPDVVGTISEHVKNWSAPVVVHAAWERNIKLVRRTYGDDSSGAEAWTGQPTPVFKRLRVPGSDRRLVVAGYLLNQRHAMASWSGLTARVQNVAVEEQTFFDVTADPGFRKYISGEVWLMGELDRERLINIDRASFNRECGDYQVVRRFLARALVEFKSAKVQRPQRAKVTVRRQIEHRIATIAAIRDVVIRATECLGDSHGLPSSERLRRIAGQDASIDLELVDLGVDVTVVDGDDAPSALYVLEVADDGERVVAKIARELVAPVVYAGSWGYRLCFRRGGGKASAVVVRNRPRCIMIDLDHPSHGGESAHAKIAVGVALEIAYLLGDQDGAAGVYEQMLKLIAAL
jgi:Histidine kinase-, DNA gyrase B-, and HSP90-like ATPase